MPFLFGLGVKCKECGQAFSIGQSITAETQGELKAKIKATFESKEAKCPDCGHVAAYDKEDLVFESTR